MKNKKDYIYWHVVVSGVGFYAKRYSDRVEFQKNGFEIPDLVMDNATRYDVRKWIDECLNKKRKRYENRI